MDPKSMQDIYTAIAICFIIALVFCAYKKYKDGCNTDAFRQYQDIYGPRQIPTNLQYDWHGFPRFGTLTSWHSFDQ